MEEFRLFVPAPTGWTHVVVNYDREGVSIYHNGSIVTRTTQRRGGRYMFANWTDDSICASFGVYNDGRFLEARHYGSFHIDELVLFNRNLSQDDITLLTG